MAEPVPRLPLFVYGTLLPGEMNYAHFLAGKTEQLAPAHLNGELWWMTDEDYPYLCPGEKVVHGLLVTIMPAEFEAVIQAIDALEDYYPGAPEKSLYLRQQVMAIATGREETAWTYLWNRPERPGRRILSGDFTKRRENSEG